MTQPQMLAEAPLNPSQLQGTETPRAPEPRWWTGQAPIAAEAFRIDARDYADGSTPLEENAALADRMRETFDRVGLVHVTGTGLDDLGRMRALAKHVIQTDMNYKGGANPRDALQPNVYEIGAPLPAWLHYHHEMAYVGHSTSMLGFLYKHATPGKGATFVSDNVRATEALLATPFGQKLKAHGLCYHRKLTDRDAYIGTDNAGVYNHWQKSMMTEDPAEAEAAARARGLETEWGPDRLLITRYTTSAFEYFPGLDRNLLFSSIADDSVWFDAWPKVMHLPHELRPLKLTFGNGEEITPAEVRQFIDVYDEFGMPIEWSQGDVAIVCNYRFAHGRPAIHLEPGEKRELGVMIGAAFERVEALPDKW
ncbi:MAG: TauD/TfdA family dioxygenase [Devosiaceae bacterium]|nr:TauD/TfdA family dioxygenase [Devosiaceae bacterium MH13]